MTKISTAFVFTFKISVNQQMLPGISSLSGNCWKREVAGTQWEWATRREVGEEGPGRTGIKKPGGLEWYGLKVLAQEAKEDLDTRRPAKA